MLVFEEELCQREDVHVKLQNVRGSMGTWRLGLTETILMECDLLD